MSLEAQIQQLNTNICTLIAVLQGQSATVPAKTLPPASEKPATPAPTLSPEMRVAEAVAKTEAPAALDYEKDVKPKVLEVSSRKGRDACMAVLGKFGLASAKAAKPEQYADLIKACEEALK